MFRPPALRALCAALLLTAPAQGAPAAAPGAFKHVFVLVLENHSFEKVIGNPNLPTLGALARSGGLATNYSGVAHPSLPNYVALIAGSTMGMTSNDTSKSFTGATLASQLEAKGLSWRGYMQGLPRAGSNVPYAGVYGKKHNPFMLNADIAGNPKRARYVVPFEQLKADLDSNQVANFSLLVPDLCHDLHGDQSCPGRENAQRTGDAFIKKWTGAIMTSKVWVPGTALIITFDEGEGGDGRGGGGRIPTIILTPGGKAGVTSNRPYNHYSLLRTIQNGFGLAPLRNAANAQPMSDLLP